MGISNKSKPANRYWTIVAIVIAILAVVAHSRTVEHTPISKNTATATAPMIPPNGL
jgi:hypothetical protein